MKFIFRSIIVICSFYVLLVYIAQQPSYATFPGTNGKIAFLSIVSGDYEIFTMNPDGSGRVNLSNNPASDSDPAWSADGSKIVFWSFRDGNAQIYTMNADGTGLFNVSNNAVNDAYPSWSPDGTQIVFASVRDGSFELYVMNADGTGQTRLTNNSSSDYTPAWSPDGSKIIFFTDRDSHPQIYMMNPDGSGQTNISNNAYNDSAASWSPDGTQIAFESTRDGNAEVYVMNADGTGQTRLTNNPAFDSAASWSPDGTQIVFASNREANAQIYLMNPDGSGQINISNTLEPDLNPNWGAIPIVPSVTPQPGSTSSSGNSSANSPSSSAPSCSNAAPGSAPDLFQVNVTNAKAVLYFAPATAPNNNYFISYGFQPGEERFGVTFNQGESGGVLSYDINALTPNTTYYFRIRGGNGCMSGNWSNEMKIKTLRGAQGGTIFYKNFLSRLLSILPQKVTAVESGSSQVMTSGNSCEYIVQPGDSLWSIAIQQFGTGTKYINIMQMNALSSTLISNGQKLKVGCT